MKNVTSKDQRKKEVMRLFKERTNATRITCVKEYKDHFEAHCQVYSDGFYDSLGIFKLNKEDFEFGRSHKIYKLYELGKKPGRE